MAEWVRPLIINVLHCPSSHHCGFETSQVLPAGAQVVFLGDLPFTPHLKFDSAQNERNNLD